MIATLIILSELVWEI